MKRILFVAAMLALLLNACGPAAAPTIDPAQVQASAIAAASTMIAQTQAAIPTATPIPPTPLPSPTALPSPTPIPLPTLSIQSQPTTTTNPSGDPCNAPMAKSVDGRPTIIKIQNNTKAAIIVSLYLNKTAFGECGYRGYNIAKGDSATITDLVQGCYNAGAFINDPKKPSKAFGYGCINNTDKWTFEVNADFIKFVGP